MAYNTIKVKKYLDIVEEFTANATIYPGMLVEEMSTGKLRAHATAAGNAIPMFALEDELQGNDIDDNYADGDQVKFRIFLPGDVVNARLATSQVIAKDSKLESAGSGLLRALNAGTPIAVAREAVTTTTAVKRICAEIM
jgi:hypothetical protein